MSDALQAALAGEYAVMHAYGRAGARLRTGRDRALELLAVHRTRRDQARAWLSEEGEDPLPPEPAYDVGDPVDGPDAARALLARVELRLIPLYAEVIADAMDDPQRRAWAIRAIRESALTAQSWGAPGQAFPWPEGVIPPV